MDSEEDSKREDYSHQEEEYEDNEGFQEESKHNMQKKIESTEEIILEHIDNDKLIQTPNNESEEITNLDFDIRGNVYICVFLAGVSKNKHNIFKTTIINNRMDFDDFLTIKEDQKFFELLTIEPVIILKAIEYTIETQMITVLEHIIDESTANYLDMHIKDDVIKKLI